MVITDLDETLLRDGIALAAGREVDFFIRTLTAMCREFHDAAVVDRARWDALPGEFAALHAKLAPALEYAKCFTDQWPDAEDES